MQRKTAVPGSLPRSRLKGHKEEGLEEKPNSEIANEENRLVEADNEVDEVTDREDVGEEEEVGQP